MEVNKIYINTYKYDFYFAKICISSIRFWYPEIPIVLIKDVSKGEFDTSKVERMYNVKIFETSRKSFGWGFGKWEPLFLENNDSFLVLDADTAFVGPVLDKVKYIDSQFIVDEEIQPAAKFNEIYYNTDRIKEVNPEFNYPGFSFNEGQWFGTSGIFKRRDFEDILHWSEPPKSKYPDIIYQGAQGHLNYKLQDEFQKGNISLSRLPIMIWPSNGNADFIDFDKLIVGSHAYDFIIHWAGMPFRRLRELPRADILLYYVNLHYAKSNKFEKVIDNLKLDYYYWEKRLVNFYKFKVKSFIS